MAISSRYANEIRDIQRIIKTISDAEPNVLKRSHKSLSVFEKALYQELKSILADNRIILFARMMARLERDEAFQEIFEIIKKYGTADDLKIRVKDLIEMENQDFIEKETMDKTPNSEPSSEDDKLASRTTPV